MTKTSLLIVFLTVLASIPGYTTGRPEEPSTGEPPVEITIGYQNVPSSAIIVKSMGWYEEAVGIPVRWVLLDSGADLNTALATGSIDIGFSDSTRAVAAVAHGLPVEIVWIHGVTSDPGGLVVRKKAEIETLEDLHGRRLAVSFGSSSHFHLLVVLSQSKVAEDAVQLVDLEPSAMVSQWEHAEIDAAYVRQPYLDRLRENDGGLLFSSGAVGAEGYPTADVALVQRDFARSHPSAVALYLAYQDKAVRYFREYPEESSAAVGRELGLSGTEARGRLRTLGMLTGPEQLAQRHLGRPGNIGDVAQLLNGVADTMVAHGMIAGSLDIGALRNVVNPTYVVKALEARASD